MAFSSKVKITSHSGIQEYPEFVRYILEFWVFASFVGSRLLT